MPGLVRARLVNVSSAANPPPSVQVQFNPTDYGIDGSVSYAQMPVPGLQMPIQQFIRGEAEHLTLELFLDQTDTPGGKAQSIKARLDQLRTFVLIDPALHAPPVCRFEWGDQTFTGVVISIREKLALFNSDGNPVRARVTLTLRSYKSAEVQLRELKRMSPDRTHVRVLREGETLAQISNEAYGDPRHWRAIAEANDIDHPRLVKPGTPLKVPSL